MSEPGVQFFNCGAHSGQLLPVRQVRAGFSARQGRSANGEFQHGADLLTGQRLQALDRINCCSVSQAISAAWKVSPAPHGVGDLHWARWRGPCAVLATEDRGALAAAGQENQLATVL